MRLPKLVTMVLIAAILVWMILLQFVLTPFIQAPWVIFWVLGALWAGTGVLVWFHGYSGAIITSLYGMVSAWASIRNHSVKGPWNHSPQIENWILVTISVLVGLAGIWLWLDTYLRRKVGPGPVHEGSGAD